MWLILFASLWSRLLCTEVEEALRSCLDKETVGNFVYFKWVHLVKSVWLHSHHLPIPCKVIATCLLGTMCVVCAKQDDSALLRLPSVVVSNPNHILLLWPVLSSAHPGPDYYSFLGFDSLGIDVHEASDAYSNMVETRHRFTWLGINWQPRNSPYKQFTNKNSTKISHLLRQCKKLPRSF